MAPLRTLVVLLSIVSLSSAANLTTLDGKKSMGEIVSIDGKEVVFQTPTGNETYELTKLESIDFGAAKESPKAGKSIEVELIDGSHFHCADFKIRGKSAVLTLL